MRSVATLALLLSLASAPAAAFTCKFGNADTDGDGRVSQAEAQAWTEQSFAAADTNGDQTIGEDEYRDQFNGIMNPVDSDNDGYITSDEYLANCSF